MFVAVLQMHIAFVRLCINLYSLLVQEFEIIILKAPEFLTWKNLSLSIVCALIQLYTTLGWMPLSRHHELNIDLELEDKKEKKGEFY